MKTGPQIGLTNILCGEALGLKEDVETALRKGSYYIYISFRGTVISIYKEIKDKIVSYSNPEIEP